MHVPGPVNGNPYAQIDPALKERLRTRPSVQHVNKLNLSRGIEDLDSLLGELGFMATEPDINANTHVLLPSSRTDTDFKPIHSSETYVRGKSPRPSIGEIKQAPVVMEGKNNC